MVALRKESVDRNMTLRHCTTYLNWSLSARRAWIEIRNAATLNALVWSLSARRAWIEMACQVCVFCWVASLSARRAWIEIVLVGFTFDFLVSLSARRAWIEMLSDTSEVEAATGRSPQGERG